MLGIKEGMREKMERKVGMREIEEYERGGYEGEERTREELM